MECISSGRLWLHREHLTGAPSFPGISARVLAGDQRIPQSDGSQSVCPGRHDNRIQSSYPRKRSERMFNGVILSFKSYQINFEKRYG